MPSAAPSDDDGGTFAAGGKHSRDDSLNDDDAGAQLASMGDEAPQGYAQLVRALQQRSMNRSVSTPARGGGPSLADEANRRGLSQVEQDLRLAAQVGQTLLNEKGALQVRLESSERANQKLLERLGKAVRENMTLERRLEESLGNLDQADASNRALLVSLEEDRKTISRLSHDSGKLVAVTATLKQLQTAHADLLEDLAAERRRADSAEARARKTADRAEDLDERLRKACSDLEEMRQAKVLSAKRSSDALALLRAKQPAPGGGASPGGADEAGDADSAPAPDASQTRELMRIVETLVEENQLLRSESMELHGLLEREREDQELARGENGFLSALGIRTAPGSGGDEDEERAGAGVDPDDGDQVPRRRAGFFPRRQSASSTFSQTSPQLDQSQSSTFGAVESGPLGKRPAAARTRSGAPVGGKIPVGRPRNRRTQSVDLSSQVQPTDTTTSAPTSPNPASARAASIFSNASEDPDTSLTSSERPRRKHRPLSLSLNSSVFSPAPAADTSLPEAEESVLVSPFTRTAPAHRRQSSQTSFKYGLASPRLEQTPQRSLRSPRPSPSRRTSSARTVDMSTQTTPPPSLRPLPVVERAVGPSTRPQSPLLDSADAEHRSLRELTASPISSAGAPSSSGPSGPSRAAIEPRTAALGQLIEYGSKLLARVQAADIATQEKRLRKQNLPGDVKHLAQAAIRELMEDVDQLRDRFRRIVELERAAHHRDLAGKQSSGGGQPDDQSLVTRRDFVSLVKLLRDLLSETSRLRLLLNRVQLEPALAQNLRQLDAPGAGAVAVSASDRQPGQGAGPGSSAGLLAPITRLLGVGSPDQRPSADESRSISVPARRGGGSTVSTAAVNVEYGGGTVRSATPTDSPDVHQSSPREQVEATARPRHVRRELSSIFAGASSAANARRLPPQSLAASQPAPARAVPVPDRGPSAQRFVSAAASAATSYNPFSRILSSYRPAMSSTTNAVLDSIPHAPPVLDSPFDGGDNEEGPLAHGSPPPTLLERQLRPRGLSDSSIRSTFTTHGALSRPNPHHRVVTVAGLAMSSETKPVPIVVAPAGVSVDQTQSGEPVPGLSSSPASLGAAAEFLRQKLEQDEADTAAALAEGKTISRRASRAQLRGRSSLSRLRESATLSSSPPPPVPAMPDELRVSTSSTTTSDSSLDLPPPSSSSSPNPTIAVEAPNSPAAPVPISISTPPRKRSVGRSREREREPAGASSLFGTVVSSAFGSLVGTGHGPGGLSDKRIGSNSAHGAAESWRDRSRLG